MRGLVLAGDNEKVITGIVTWTRFVARSLHGLFNYANVLNIGLSFPPNAFY